MPIGKHADDADELIESLGNETILAALDNGDDILETTHEEHIRECDLRVYAESIVHFLFEDSVELELSEKRVERDDIPACYRDHLSEVLQIALVELATEKARELAVEQGYRDSKQPSTESDANGSV